jgi:hypothetical protein
MLRRPDLESTIYRLRTMFDTKTLILDGIYNKRSPDWDEYCKTNNCVDPPVRR